MNDDPAQASILLKEAYRALRRGNRVVARRLAQQSAALAPDQEEVWLLMAALSSPEASIFYLKKALEINPDSARARQGMHWAIQRVRASKKTTPIETISQRKNVVQPISSDAMIKPRPALLPWAVVFLLILAAAAVWSGLPSLSLPTQFAPLSIAQFQVAKETRTPTLTATNTATQTATQTLTPTATNTETPTPLPTDTPTPTETPTSTPTIIPTDTATAAPTEPPATPKPKKSKRNKTSPAQQQYVGRPDGVDANERWIDVNLSLQTTYAYEGDTLVNSFLVSTGTWQHPTVTGVYRIYVKYVSTLMVGPGYYLPNVPYTMYFYKGYGLHGTYWHHNFGTPMSHGCVNLYTPDAQWLFGWASVGTVVNVHY